MRKALIRGAIGLSTVAALIIPATVVVASGPPLYNSTLSLSSVGNLPSVGAEAYSFNEFGNEVNLTGVKLGKVTVMMSSWGCVTGHWNSGDCGTPSGSTFNEPITFNIYNPPALNSDVPGTLIATRTVTFKFPYRPSANYAHCSGGNAGLWWDKALATCFNGKAFDITFSFGIKLPTTDVVFGIAYNTTHYGYAPIGESAACYTSSGGCGYDSLNIALTQDNGTGHGGNVSAGSDRYPGKVYQNAVYGSDYCDGGTAGVNIFRLDSPTGPSCWGTVSPYTNAPFFIPAVKFAHS
jgi:hypothetical protein